MLSLPSAMVPSEVELPPLSAMFSQEPVALETLGDTAEIAETDLLSSEGLSPPTSELVDLEETQDEHQGEFGADLDETQDLSAEPCESGVVVGTPNAYGPLRAIVHPAEDMRLMRNLRTKRVLPDEPTSEVPRCRRRLNLDACKEDDDFRRLCERRMNEQYFMFFKQYISWLCRHLNDERNEDKDSPDWSKREWMAVVDWPLLLMAGMELKQWASPQSVRELVNKFATAFGFPPQHYTSVRNRVEILKDSKVAYQVFEKALRVWTTGWINDDVWTDFYRVTTKQTYLDLAIPGWSAHMPGHRCFMLHLGCLYFPDMPWYNEVNWRGIIGNTAYSMPTDPFYVCNPLVYVMRQLDKERAEVDMTHLCLGPLASLLRHPKTEVERIELKMTLRNHYLRDCLLSESDTNCPFTWLLDHLMSQELGRAILTDEDEEYQMVVEEGEEL